jgi:hypothetical protein
VGPSSIDHERRRTPLPRSVGYRAIEFTERAARSEGGRTPICDLFLQLKIGAPPVELPNRTAGRVGPLGPPISRGRAVDRQADSSRIFARTYRLFERLLHATLSQLPLYALPCGLSGTMFVRQR